MPQFLAGSRNREIMAARERQPEPKQLLHLVFGGRLKDMETVEFENLDELDIVGIYPDYASAYDAWKAVSHRTVDTAEMRYFIVHMHRLLDPENDTPGTPRR